MSEANLRQLRILHVVSSGGVASGLQQSLLMPLLTRMPKARVEVQVVCLAPGAVPAAVLRQNGVPVHDVALSRRRYSLRGFRDLVRAAREFRPDIIQAWGHTAQIYSIKLRKRCKAKPPVIWSVSDTAPLGSTPGFIDRRKLKLAAKRSKHANRIVYASEAGAAHHRRAGFPDGGHLVVPPGVDAARFKTDSAVRRKVREKLELPASAFVIGMVAPFRPEYDHATLIKAVGELVKTNSDIYLVLAGHGVQKGNAPLMTLVGGGNLGTRTQLLGEWSDLASLFNACDVACSSAVTDGSRMMLVMAMLCGVPCVATGMGAQGEVIGQFGVSIEPGSPAAFVKGIKRVMQLTPEKRALMAQGARKHALRNFVDVRSLQKYLQLYCELVGEDLPVAEQAPIPAPEVEPAVAVTRPPSAETDAMPTKAPIRISELSDPDSLESKVAAQPAEELPKWRREQEEERAKQEAHLLRQLATVPSEADILQVFEAELSQPSATVALSSDRARGIAEEVEELLPAEMLQAPAGWLQRSAAPDTSAENGPIDGESAAIKAAEPPDQDPTIQLELLPDPPEERKRAAGES